MNHFARRTAGIIAAVALVSGLAAGCSNDDEDGKSSDTGMATTTEMAQATGHEGEHGTDTPDTDSPETKIATAHGEVTVAGAVLEKYNALGGPTGVLGDPIADQRDAPGGGTVQEFEGGAIYGSPATGAHVVWGEIRTAYLASGGPGGTLGYPTTDEMDIEGGKQSDFTGGTITWVNEQTTVTEK
ncbi:esterase [Nocardia uniformis]|uniref:Esterase n=1 Tax=Nocardia uniformis TaxID=53432 RepID=A0A849C073_9NOCA|nr:hypothetical protein [Nocardia uniformis]NNH69900.1 esterase [Nocardia uniformis]